MPIHACETSERRFGHVSPAIENPGSNVACRKSGFVKIGETDLGYPKGHPMNAMAGSLISIVDETQNCLSGMHACLVHWVLN